MLDLTERSVGDVRVLAISGRFDGFSSGPVRDWLHQRASEPPGRLVVNLSGVTFLDSTGLGTIVHGVKRCRAQQGDLHVCGVPAQVRVVFELTKLDKVLRLFPDEADAVAGFRE